MNGGGLASASALTVAGGGLLNFNGAGVSFNGPLTNSGTINWSGGAINLNNNQGIYSGAIYNQPGGLFNAQNDSTVASGGYGFEFFKNAGTIRKSAGLGLTSFNVSVTNSGTIDAQTGIIRFNSGGNLAGTYNTAAGASVRFDAGTYTENGVVTITGAGSCYQNGATIVLTDQITNFSLDSGNVMLATNFQTTGAIQNLELDGAYLVGTNKVTGTLGMNGGGVPSGSSLTVAVGGILNFDGATVTLNGPLTNSGTVNWSSGNITINNNNAVLSGALHNLSGGLLLATCDQSVTSGGYGFEFCRNAGTIRKTAGLGLTTIGVTATNTGLVDAQSGIVRFSAGGTLGGTYNTDAGSFIEFIAGTFTETGVVTVTGAGITRQNGATVILNDRIANLVLIAGNVVLVPAFETTGKIQSLQLDGASLIGSNTVTGTLVMNGGIIPAGSTLTVAPGGTFNVGAPGLTLNGPLTNSGTVNWSGAGNININNNNLGLFGAVYNQPGGLFIARNDQSVTSGGYGLEQFNNTGTIRKLAGFGTTTFSLPFVTSGTIDSQIGQIRFASAYTSSGGTMNLGITSQAFYGTIAFSSGAPLTGTVSANFNGYTPNIGDTFNLVTYVSRLGVFTNLSMPQGQWTTNYSSTVFSVTCTNTSGGNVIQSPVTLTPITYSAGHFTLQVAGPTGPAYSVEFSTNLVSWISLGTNTPLVVPFTVTDSNAVFGRRFYRAVLDP